MRTGASLVHTGTQEPGPHGGLVHTGARPTRGPGLHGGRGLGAPGVVVCVEPQTF